MLQTLSIIEADAKQTLNANLAQGGVQTKSTKTPELRRHCKARKQHISSHKSQRNIRKLLVM